MNETATILGRKITAKREEMGLAMNTLARRIGITRESVRKIEDGKREPGWSTVQLLALALGLSTEDLRNPALAVIDYTPDEKYKPRKTRTPKMSMDAPPAEAPVAEPARKPRAKKRGAE